MIDCLCRTRVLYGRLVNSLCGPFPSFPVEWLHSKCVVVRQLSSILNYWPWKIAHGALVTNLMRYRWCLSDDVCSRSGCRKTESITHLGQCAFVRVVCEWFQVLVDRITGHNKWANGLQLMLYMEVFCRSNPVGSKGRSQISGLRSAFGGCLQEALVCWKPWSQMWFQLEPNITTLANPMATYFLMFWACMQKSMSWREIPVNYNMTGLYSWRLSENNFINILTNISCCLPFEKLWSFW